MSQYDQESLSPHDNFVIGPDGRHLTRADLPPGSTTRWVIRRKAELVAAVQGGLLTPDEVEKIYGITPEEFATWESMISRHGMQGLRTTRIRHYRMKSK